MTRSTKTTISTTKPELREKSDVHDQLVFAYLEYFKANEKFLYRPSEPKRRDVRRWLSTIRKLALVRREEIMDIHRNKYERERELQKRQGNDSDTTN